MPRNKGPVSPIDNLKGRTVPGGTSQAGRKYSPTPGGMALKPYSVNVGQRRGFVGHGTADVRGRTPSQQDHNARGNYGGGYAGITGGRKSVGDRRG